MSVYLDRILISPFRVDFLYNVHEPVKPVSLPFLHCIVIPNSQLFRSVHRLSKLLLSE